MEYVLARAVLFFFGALPRSVAQPAAQTFAWCGFHLARRQREAGIRNLGMAFPEKPAEERLRILRGVFDNLARLLVEFPRFPRLNKANIADHVVYDGFENYQEAARRGRGVIYLTGHFGAWELCPLAHSIYGYPLKFIVRPIDNPRIDALISSYRSLGGNVPIDKWHAGREVIKTLRDGGGVGILFDQNTTSDEGVFVDFFGIPAATTTAVAAFALRTGAAVLPGFLIWDASIRKHRLRFEPPVQLVETGDLTQDIAANTQKFSAILENLVRRYPDQWLWIHKRWKTRPEGEKSLY